MNSKKEYLKTSRLYAVTDLKEAGPAILQKAEQALKGGVDILQLRAKTLSTASLLKIGEQLRVITRKFDKLFIVNDRADVAAVLDADGVHLGQEDMPIDLARKIIGKKIIGRSTHSLEQAVLAQRQGADYIGFGPIFETPTKPSYAPVGLDLIPRVIEKISIPVVLIGGIDHPNITQVIERGGRCVAVVRAIFASQEPFQSAHELKMLLTYQTTVLGN